MELFSEVLEYPGRISEIDNYESFAKNKIYKETEKFITDNFSENENLIVSLSGGVDSDVLITLFQEIKKKININIIAAHINYCNRNETEIEEKFLEYWCQKNNYKFELLKIKELKRGENKRSYYEEYIRKKRYGFYQELIEKYNSKGIFLGHHLNDLQENVMCNIMKGRNIFDLKVMKNKSIINDVTIYRPFLNIYKKDIYDFAHQNNVPYFKDTTPEWSNRGKLRNKLFPLLQEIYGINCLDNLLELGDSSDEWKEIVDKKIINDFILKNIKFSNKGIIINYQNDQNSCFNFWNSVFLELCHNNLGVSMISNNCLKNLLSKLKTSNSCQITFKKGWSVFIYDKKIIILYDEYQQHLKYNFTKKIIDSEEFIKNKEIVNEISIYNILEDDITYIIPYDQQSILTFCYNKKNLKNFKRIPNNLLKLLPIMNYEKNQDFSNSKKFYKINMCLIK